MPEKSKEFLQNNQIKSDFTARPAIDLLFSTAKAWTLHWPARVYLSFSVLAFSFNLKTISRIRPTGCLGDDIGMK